MTEVLIFAAGVGVGTMLNHLAWHSAMGVLRPTGNTVVEHEVAVPLYLGHDGKPRTLADLERREKASAIADAFGMNDPDVPVEADR